MKLEELIQQRKDHLDVEAPPPELWQNIANEWKKPAKKTFEWWKVAAVVFICCSIGLFIQNRLLQSQVDDLASLSDLSDHYASLENDYLHQVALLEESTSIKELSTIADYQWVFEELQLLEEINVQYRSDIGKVNQELLVHVLIDYYEKKIKLLRKLELEIERNSNRNKNEKTDSDHIRI